MNNLTIKAKLYGITVGISVLLIIMGVFAIHSLGNVNEKSTEIAKSWMPRISVAGEINTLTSDYRIQQYNHVVSEDSAKMAEVEKSMADLNKQIDVKFTEYDKLVLDSSQKGDVDQIKADWTKYVKETGYILDLSRQQKTVEAGKELQGLAEALYMDVSKKIGELNAACIEGGEKASAEGDATYKSASEILIGVIAVVIILIIAALFMITRSIASGIQTVLQAAEKIADGDLKVALNMQGKDEIAMLSKAMEKMAQHLKALIGQIQKTASQVAASSEELTASADQSADVTQTIAQSITDVAELSNKQVTAVNSTTQIIEQISAGIEETAASVGMATEQTRKAVDTAKSGSQTLDAAVAQMSNIEVTVNKSAEVVTKLGQRSKEIGQIVDTISGIAGQTNLLALNAAIEAARAGEQGKGFAVVAEEVRKLAEQSQEAAKQIASLIAEIQGDTDQAVIAMNAGTQEVQQGSNVVKEAGSAFVEILGMVNIVNQQSTEVAKTMEELAGGTQRIVESVQQIDGSSKNVADEAQSVSAATEEQSASMEEIAAASRNLANLAQELQEAGSRFRL